MEMGTMDLFSSAFVFRPILISWIPEIVQILLIETHINSKVSCVTLPGTLTSDVQGLVNPPRVKGGGQEGKGQGKDFMTLNKPLTLLKGQGFCWGFSGVFISLISRYSRCCMPIKLSVNDVESKKRPSKEASLPLQHLLLSRIH
jgi:hypothetical protein